MSDSTSNPPPGAAPDPDADAPPDDPREIAYLYQVFDSVIEELADDAHADPIARARRQYEDRRGRVFEDEELWEAWTDAFLEWYAIERPGDDGAPPATAYLTAIERDAAAGPDDRHRARALRAWLTSHRSLFEVRALSQGRVALLDLLGGGQFSVVEKRTMAGVSAGDIAEMRLIGFAGEVVFGRTFCFHPPGTRRAILGHARRMLQSGSTRVDVIDFCASLRIRWQRYQHVAAERIYEAQPGEDRITS